jgi:hypothetical protein
VLVLALVLALVPVPALRSLPHGFSMCSLQMAPGRKSNSQT